MEFSKEVLEVLGIPGKFFPVKLLMISHELNTRTGVLHSSLLVVVMLPLSCGEKKRRPDGE